jgi:hypothetical protein
MAHGASGYREKMRTVVPLNGPPVDQADIGFVHQRGRLKAVLCTLTGHATPGDAVELVIDERDQPLQGALIASTPLDQQAGDFRLVLMNSGILSGPRTLHDVTDDRQALDTAIEELVG